MSPWDRRGLMCLLQHPEDFPRRASPSMRTNAGFSRARPSARARDQAGVGGPGSASRRVTAAIAVPERFAAHRGERST